MIPDDHSALSIEFPVRTDWIPAIQGFIEAGVPVLGLDPKKTIRLSMASEEILLHLSGCASESRVKIILVREPARIAASFLFDSHTADLWAMNLTAAGEISSDPEQGMSHMGLLLASRVVDSFSISLVGRQAGITLYQNLAYPEIQTAAAGVLVLRGTYTIDASPQAAEISQACAQTLAGYPDTLYPEFFRTPGKIMDLISGNQFHAATVKDPIGTIAGMICWEMISSRSTPFYGPYIFTEPKEAVARLLVDHLINSAARTPVKILYSLMATADLPPNDFEVLARFNDRGLSDPSGGKTIWFRHLREDLGCHVWAHPALSPFLKETYERLFLLRTIREFSHSGEKRPERSLFGADLDKNRKQAMLWPMLDGADIRENIQQHVRFLLAEGFRNIFFTLDLFAGWQAAMAEVLMNSSFLPAYVLPWAGESDKVIFHYAAPVA